MEKGTSAPTFMPMAHSSPVSSRAPYSAFSPTSTAAASALPPAMPARTGTALCTVMCAPARSPVSSKKARAALYAVLCLPPGTRLPGSSTVRPRLFSTVTRSYKLTACIIMSSVW